MLVMVDENTDRVELVQTLILDYWKDYIEDNWLSGGDDMDGGEVRVKRMLDACGYLLLRNIDTDGIVTEYKEAMSNIREIPISATPEIMRDALYSAVKHGEYYDDSGGMDIIGDNIGVVLGKPKKRFETRTRFDKIYAAKLEYPGCTAEWQRLDTHGRFWDNGVEYKVSHDVAEYRPKATKIGLYYAADSILVLSGNSGKRYYSQDINRIDGKHIIASKA